MCVVSCGVFLLWSVEHICCGMSLLTAPVCRVADSLLFSSCANVCGADRKKKHSFSHSSHRSFSYRRYSLHSHYSHCASFRSYNSYLHSPHVRRRCIICGSCHTHQNRPRSDAYRLDRNWSDGKFHVWAFIVPRLPDHGVQSHHQQDCHSGCSPRC